MSATCCGLETGIVVVCRKPGPCTVTCTEPVVVFSLARRNSRPRKQARKKTIAQTMAQVGMFWLVTDMSVKVHDTSASGRDPLGVYTVVEVTEMSPITTRTGSPAVTGVPAGCTGCRGPGCRGPGCWKPPGQPGCCPGSM